MAGSIPIATYTFEKTSENSQAIKETIKQLTEKGWKWYVDFYVNWEASILIFEVYNKDMIEPVKFILLGEIL